MYLVEKRMFAVTAKYVMKKNFAGSYVKKYPASVT
jgi:hypothetical protein